MERSGGIERSGSLFDNLLLFGRLLRGLGLDIDTGRMIELTQALGEIEITNRTDFYFTLRTLLVHRREELPVFDSAFAAFWGRAAKGGGLPARVDGKARRSNKPWIAPPPLRLPDPSANSPQPAASKPDGEPPVIEATLTYSSLEVLRRKDFADLDPEEMEAIKTLIAELNWQPGLRRSRRWQPGKGPAVDLRHMLRRNLRFGGEVMVWLNKAQKYKPRPLVIIADISGSMERYTRLLLHFAYSLNLSFGSRVETFVFGTRLTRITRPMRNRQVSRALSEVAASVQDWSGGTRIGEALKTFNFDWARRMLGRGAIVLLISDGWDRGDPEQLRKEIIRLQRSCYRLIWLNPLLGSPQYEPLARGMQAALPHIDDFLPVHNLASLEDLARRLETLNMPRQRRNHHERHPA